MLAPIRKSDGSLMSYYDPFYADMKEFEVFFDVLTLKHQYRGRSAAGFIFEGELTKREYPMFLSEMTRIIQYCGIGAGGRISGHWDVMKRGTAYGIKLKG